MVYNDTNTTYFAVTSVPGSGNTLFRIWYKRPQGKPSFVSTGGEERRFGTIASATSYAKQYLRSLDPEEDLRQLTVAQFKEMINRLVNGDNPTLGKNQITKVVRFFETRCHANKATMYTGSKRRPGTGYWFIVEYVSQMYEGSFTGELHYNMLMDGIEKYLNGDTNNPRYVYTSTFYTEVQTADESKSKFLVALSPQALDEIMDI